MGWVYLWAVAVCGIIFSPFAGRAGAQGAGDLATPVAAKDWSEYGIGDELFHEPVFTIQGQAVAERRQGKHSANTGHTPEIPIRQAQEVYGKLPLYFIQNEGQMDERVKFYERDSGHAMFFTEDGVYLSLTSGQEARSEMSDAGSKRREVRSEMQDARSKKSETRNQMTAIRNQKSKTCPRMSWSGIRNPQL